MQRMPLLQIALAAGTVFVGVILHHAESSFGESTARRALGGILLPAAAVLTLLPGTPIHLGTCKAGTLTGWR